MTKTWQNIVLIATVLISNWSISQYDEEVIRLKALCDAENASDLFDLKIYDCEKMDDMTTFSRSDDENFYLIDYSDGYTVSSYIEPFDKANLKLMKATIRKMARPYKSSKGSKVYKSKDYFYVVSSLKDEDYTILISITKRNRTN